MKQKWYHNFIGARTLKTGVATFLTALFCLLLDLNPIFAILTAVVTIEPTAKASLRKGYKRLPATVIGALVAVVATFFFGDDSALAYALSATLTILLCTKLKLNAGTTVATLTSVAMIPGIHDAYVFNFVSRLFTAIIGLITAGLVNYLLFPPKYYNQLHEKIKESESHLYLLFDSRMKELMIGLYKSKSSDKKLEKLLNLNTKIEQLIGYQRDELKYHKHQKSDWVNLRKITNRAHENRMLMTHLSNIIYLPNDTVLHFTDEEKVAIIEIVEHVAEITTTERFVPTPTAATTLKNSVKGLEEFDNHQLKSHIIYEILLLYRILLQRYNPKTLSKESVGPHHD
ncbi:FUSC family protein [Staphylococcus massiliensis]|uniref:FUSC family protein n=1 Tax=Staphylococcus massiliensis TaxID=555791 RepID=UPI001EE11FB0|nr:aromatic acid exporter family protein [Staphylococcus massiliensis]MCG3402664.1 FUSC family protein [Staphylococcus massiliensis]